jgi:hypothetical protein
MLVFQASNPALWLGLEGSLESNDAVAGLTTNVSSMDEGHQQMNESMAQLNDPTGNLLSHSEEVETMSIEAMEVDVHVSLLLSVSAIETFTLGLFFFNRRQQRTARLKKSALCPLTISWNRPRQIWELMLWPVPVELLQRQQAKNLHS